MHVNPYLIIEDEKYLVDDFTFGFSQKPNAVGLPATFPVFQGLDVVIRGHYPGFFLERWACASGQPKLVELVLKPLVLGSGPTRVFTFFDAHLVHFTKNYSEKKNPPVEMHLRITAGGVRDSFSKSEYSAPWRETFEKPGIVAARSTTDEECVDAGAGDVGQGEHEKENKKEIIWHEPVKNPERVINNSNGYPSLRSGAFGSVRIDNSGNIKNHGGIDIFAPIGTPIYACLDGLIISSSYRGKNKTSGYGNTVIVQVEKKALETCRNNYRLEFMDPFGNGTGGEKERGEIFDEAHQYRYLLYAHLDTMLVNKGNRVRAGDLIGTAGKTGLAERVKTPKNRHLHFEILSSSNTSGYYDLRNRENPAFYVNLKKPNSITQSNNKDINK